MFAFADSVDTFVGRFNAKVLNPAIEFLFIIAFVIFIFGVMEFIRGANNQEKRQKGKDHMIWGIVGFIIMFGVYGILNILVNTFGIKGATFTNKQQTFDGSANNIQELNLPPISK